MTKFTKEQLIEIAQENVDAWRLATEYDKHKGFAEPRLLVAEITLAVLIGKPFMHGITDPDGMAHFDEHCVAETPVTLTDEVAFLNEGCESPGEEYAIVPLYRLPLLERLK